MRGVWSCPSALPSPSELQPDSRPPTSGLNWAYVLVGVADGTLLPFVPLFLAQRGLGAPAIGGVLAAAGFVSLVSGLNWAYLADRRQRPERIVAMAGVAAAASAVVLMVTRGAIALVIAILVLWLARAPFMLLDPIALRRLRRARRTGYARIRLRMSAGWTVSATLSGALYQAISLRLLPLVYAPLAGLFGFWVWRALKPVPDGIEPAPDVVASSRSRVPRAPVALIGFLFASFLLGASMAATQNFLVLRISVLGGGALLIGAAAAFQALTEIPTMGYTHVLTRRLSHRALYAIGCAIYVVLFIAWAFVSNALIAALLKLAVGVAFALTYVASVVIADELAPARLRATGQALVKSVTFGVGPIAGSLGGGFVYGLLGAKPMFLASAVAVAAAGMIAVFAVPSGERGSTLQALTRLFKMTERATL